VTLGLAGRRPAGGLATLAVSLLLVAPPVVAQDTLLVIRPGTQVGSISFRFDGAQSFSSAELGGVLGLKSRGSLYEVRRLLGKLPFIRSPSVYRFDPVELQRDVVRLRRFYERSGFLRPAVDYDVRSKGSGGVVDVTFRIEEGPAVTLRAIEPVGPGRDRRMDLPDSLREDWRGLRTILDAGRGRRFGDAEGLAAESRTLEWLNDRGYPFAVVRSSRLVDTASRQVDVTLHVNPGARTRFGRITVEGNASVSDRVVLRELPFRTGDWYSAGKLAQARRRVQAVDLLAETVMDVAPTPTPDSALPVRLRVRESRPRFTLAELGYVSEGPGLTARVQWAHPNFTGGARSLTASIEAQTGVVTIGVQPERLLRGSLNLTQPYVGKSQLSLVVGPFAEYRDDFQDRSAAVGLSTTLIYRLAALSSVALRYQFSARRIFEYRFGDVSTDNISLLELLSLQYPPLIDSLGRNIDKSSLTLVGSISDVDDLAVPRRGWVIRPSAEVTVPGALSTVQFVRLDLSMARFQPLSPKLVLAGRFSIGRLFPFGKSVPAPGDDPTFSFIRLRDESMTAGGTNDVRGWGDRLLGPKVPNAQASIEGTDTVLVADSYVPVGALARLSGSLELRFPAPGLPPAWGTHLFVDAGKVWTPDERFSSAPLLPNETDLRFSLGVGLSYRTPVGAIGVSLGCKLNPSALDVRSPGKVLDALVAGLPVTSVEADWLRRLHLHLLFGVAL
jgi:outer membrane protein insertion porin family